MTSEDGASADSADMGGAVEYMGVNKEEKFIKNAAVVMGASAKAETPPWASAAAGAGVVVRTKRPADETSEDASESKLPRFK